MAIAWEEQGARIVEMLNPPQAQAYIDDRALAAGKVQRRPRKKELWGLYHKPTGLYLDVRNRTYAAEYALAEVPTLRPKSAVMYWLNRMRKPEDWQPERYEVRLVVVE